MEFHPIGVVRSPFKDQQGTPIQSAYAQDAPGEIVLEARFAEALADLADFERIWVLYAFERAAPYKPKVVPYRDTVERGLFATRAPCRPNPIGLSVLRLVRIEKNILHVSGIDMLDGTAVLDIKPYAPQFDAFPDSKAGWLDAKSATRRRADRRFDK